MSFICTKDPEKGTIKITVQATKLGELWCYPPPLDSPAYRKTPDRERIQAPWLGPVSD